MRTNNSSSRFNFCNENFTAVMLMIPGTYSRTWVTSTTILLAFHSFLRIDVEAFYHRLQMVEGAISGCDS